MITIKEICFGILWVGVIVMSWIAVQPPHPDDKFFFDDNN